VKKISVETTMTHLQPIWQR